MRQDSNQETTAQDVLAAAATQHQGGRDSDHFGQPAEEYRAARESAALFDLSARSKIELRGKDAVIFLHNLCTNDIKNLPVEMACEAFLTTAKARVVAHVFVSRRQREGPDVLLLDAVAGQADRLLRHLNHFLISEDVELIDRTAELALLHLCGPAAAAILNQVTGQTVTELPALRQVRYTLSSGEEVCLRRHDRLGIPGYDLLCPAGAVGIMWSALTANGAVAAGREAFETLRIEAGMPAFGQDIDDNRLVMEVGRTPQAICYTKGCFLGQEPIVMARDRGHVNRLLLRLRLEGKEPVAAGARVLADNEEAGIVTSSAYSPAQGCVIALAYIKRGLQTPGAALQVETAHGPRAATVYERTE